MSPVGEAAVRSAAYRTTPVFDQDSLPPGLRRDHNTRAGVWGVIHVLEGRLRYVISATGAETVLEPGRPGLVRPEEVHFVEPLGPMRMQVEFHEAEPALG